MNPRKWTEEEDNYIRNNFGNISYAEMSRALNRTITVIQRRAKKLGFEFEKRPLRKWTEEEVQFLIDMAPECYVGEIAKELDRREGAVISKAKELGIEYITLSRNFSDEEINYIKNNWGTISVSEMARELKVSVYMVQRQADNMGMPKLGNNPYRKWTDDKIKKLRKLAKDRTITELAKHFKTTNDAIITVASRNSIKLINENICWTEEDKLLLQEYAKTMNLSEIADKMNRTTCAVRSYASKHGITILKKKKQEDKIWTDENSRELKELVLQGKTLIEIVRIMNKKDVTLIKKAKEMGITIKREDPRNWTEEDIQNLIRLSKTKKMNELVIELGRTSGTIRIKAKELGIPIMYEQKVWTDEEYALLEHLTMIEKKSPKEIGKILGRTEDSVVTKINIRGLKIQTNDKRLWANDEEILLSDLWGSEPIEKIAGKLDRTVSSVRNKAFELGLGSQIQNNYDGLTISTICELFNARTEIVSVYWVALGLKVQAKNITKVKSYYYVEINDLFEFLENNQNIWDSRVLEKNILGKEPEWLKEKRRKDREMPIGSFSLDSLTKQQLIVTKKFFLEYEDQIDKVPIVEHRLQLVRRMNNKMGCGSNE